MDLLNYFFFHWEYIWVIVTEEAGIWNIYLKKDKI